MNRNIIFRVRNLQAIHNIKPHFKYLLWTGKFELTYYIHEDQ
jgi:hypothetical protein